VVDYAAFCVADEAVRAVALSFEGLRDPRRLFELGESARARGKRVVVLKTGRSNAASAAVQSHTGSVSGDYATFRSLFEQAGLVEVDSMEELIETARLAANWPADDVGGVGVLTNSGGTAIMAADYADEFDLPLPSLSEATTTALAAHAPGFASLANPADLTANADDWASLTESIVSFSEDPRIDLVVLPMPAPDLGERALQRPRAILEAVDRAPVSLCVVWMSEMLRAPASDLLDADPQLVTFRSLRRCMQAIGRLRYRPPVFVDGATAPGKSIVSTVAAAVDEALVKAGLVESGCITLDEAASRAILAAAGIEQVRAQEVSTAEEAVAAASTIGYPVVVKGVLRGVAHKSDLGAVRLGLADAAGVDSACREIRASVATEAPDAEVSGFLVAAMETGGFEAFVGARRDALFGAVVVGGAGGTAMESLDDVQVGIAPLPHGRATELIDRLRCAPQLRSGRGASGFDLGAFGSALDAVGQLILADERITDIDVNPLLLRPADGGAVALDASVTLRLVGPESKYDPSGGWDE
ncbi:MAG TPA: acetate--CoA ligase family protein, partial [Mycobacterium sp.]